MDYQLESKSAPVTGSTKGIGWATAALFAGGDADVILHDRSEASLQAAREAVPGAVKSAF